MSLRLPYIFRSGKRFKLGYYIKCYTRFLFSPPFFLRLRKDRMLRSLRKRSDADYIMDRVDYYNKLVVGSHPDPERDSELIPLCRQKMCRQKVYYFDSMEYAAWFPSDCRWKLIPGDVVDVPSVPAIVKSRPIGGGNGNSVLMKLNKLRHFIFVRDSLDFRQKYDALVFRGKIGLPGSDTFKPGRYRFMEMYYGNALCDLGEIGREGKVSSRWHVPKMSIADHLKYKFILALEGNDVASNLKWIMSSNSVAVMPRPRFETWFMEGRLIPDFHYIEIKDDYSDLEERMLYYIAHPEEAEAIARNANEYVAQFRDRHRERLISLLVLDKYFKVTGKNSDK